MPDQHPISILLMDDEIESPVITATIRYLEQEGFVVDTVETISDAIEAYYQRYYDVFILDIDMSMISDDQEGDGIQVLKRFISLHNQTKVIMYSAAGRSPHWIAAANAHCFAYVHKAENQAMQRLVEFIRSSQVPDSVQMADGLNTPTTVLVYAENDELESTVRSVVESMNGWELQTLKSLNEAERSAEQADRFGAIVIIQPVFKMRAEEKRILEHLLAISPLPQVIVGCEAKDEYQSSILFIANHHPFRMVDISREDWSSFLQDSLKMAHIWYGKREIFQADRDAIRRLHIRLPDDILDEWADDEMEDLYQISAKNQDEG